MHWIKEFFQWSLRLLLRFLYSFSPKIYEYFKIVRNFEDFVKIHKKLKNCVKKYIWNVCTHKGGCCNQLIENFFYLAVSLQIQMYILLKLVSWQNYILKKSLKQCNIHDFIRFYNFLQLCNFVCITSNWTPITCGIAAGPP